MSNLRNYNKMKRYFIILIALLAIATEASAYSYYGIKIRGNSVQTAYYQEDDWYYDPTNNVLHLTDYNYICANNVPYIEVDPSLNPNLTIQVDGDYTIKTQGAKAIVFKGEGTYTICGQGTLTIEPQLVNIQGVISSESGNTSLTIKDLTINITTYGSADVGFSNINYSEINLDHCEINIKSGWCAWFGNSSNYISANPVLKDCYLVNGEFIHGGAQKYVGNGIWEWMKEVSIKRTQHLEPIEHISYTIDQPTVGQPIHKTAVANGNGYSMASMGWRRYISGYGWSSELEDGYICQPEDILQVIINSKHANGYCWADEVTATINGIPVETDNSSFRTITYTFPQLTDIYYDLWIGGQRVKYSNLGDILGNGIFAYTPSSKTLKVKGSYSSSLNAPLIESSIDGLIIDVMQDAVLEASSTNGNQVFWLKDGTTTMKGKGKLTLKSLYETGIYLTNSASVVIDNMNMVIDAYWGIAGPPSGQKQEKLTIKSSNIVITTGSSTSNDLAAICDLRGGIVLQGCSITSPNGYNISNGSVYNNGNWAREVTITVDGGISTDIDAIDNGQLGIDKSLPLYNLNGQRVSHPVKGQIYIQNGRKIKF